jgi:hypothetical protein
MRAFRQSHYIRKDLLTNYVASSTNTTATSTTISANTIDSSTILNPDILEDRIFNSSFREKQNHCFKNHLLNNNNNNNNINNNNSIHYSSAQLERMNAYIGKTQIKNNMHHISSLSSTSILTKINSNSSNPNISNV